MVSGNADSDDTSERDAALTEAWLLVKSARERHESLPSSSTIVISTLQTADGSDDTNEEEIPQAHSEAATMLIPLLERDEATMQKDTGLWQFIPLRPHGQSKIAVFLM